MQKLNLAPINFDYLLNKITEAEMNLVIAISRGGKLKTKMPAVQYQQVENTNNLKYKVPELNSGSIAYLWARVAYYLSPYKKDHSSLPRPNAFFPANTKLSIIGGLNELAKMVVDSCSQNFHYGPISRGER